VLTRGSRIGAYEIVSSLGAGGMGEVYRAVDTELKREVAVKILPAAFAFDPDRLARFQREAELLASLSHANIAVLYGLEVAGDTRAIVMELVSGSDLSDRISKGPIPVSQALPIARQVADALDAAHQAGVMHRDLKPSNIKLRADGTIKVLDFGLAKAFDPSVSFGNRTETVTRAMRQSGATEAGVILGTAPYMSPEQAKGQPLDKRTDIWAFGCVLFEMLAGRAPFARETFSETVAAILDRDPDWAALPADIPRGIRRLLGRCLAKDPQHRLRDIGDARLEIEDAIGSSDADAANPTTRVTRTSPVWMLVVGALTIAVIALVATRPRPTGNTGATASPVQFAIVGPPGSDLDITRSPGISQDGRFVAFVASRGGTQQIYVRELERPEAVALPGTEGGFAPFFSPDGQWVGFFANQKIRKVPRTGGAPVSIADFAELGATKNVSASWEEPDTIFFTPDVTKGIWRVSSQGGAPTAVTTPKDRESFHLAPQVLPDGKSLLFSAIDDRPDPQTYVQRLDGGERRPLLRGHGTRYVPSGHLIFVQGGSLMAVTFDLARLEVTGSPVTVVPDVTPPFRLRTMPSSFNRLFDVSPNGTLAYLSAGRPHQHALVWVDRSGREEPTGASGGTYAQPRVSPDGRRIAVVVRGDDQHDIWLYELGRNIWNRFTTDGNCEFPLWTADGSRLTYDTDRTNTVSIEWKRVDGSGAPETIVPGAFARRSFPFSWSPDGLLAFVSVRPAQDIYTVRPGSGIEPTAFVATPFVEGAPMFSPDGHAIAYVSSETNRNEIHLRPFPGPGEKLVVSTGGGNEPVWSPTGRELFYRVGNALMAVDVTTTPQLKVGTPHRLFEQRYEPSISLYANYSTIDGQRFLMIKRTDQDDARINLIVNWFDQLKRATAR
jgi:Tol biopolymer transport system component